MTPNLKAAILFSIFNMEHQRPRLVKFKRGFNLIVGLYRYKKDGKHKDKQPWRCTQVGTGCRGRVHTTGEGVNMIVVHSTEHNQPPDEKATAGPRDVHSTVHYSCNLQRPRHTSDLHSNDR